MAWGCCLFYLQGFTRAHSLKISFQHHAFFICIYHYRGADSEQYLLMNMQYDLFYLMPDIEVVEVAVERGFDMSTSIGDWESGEDVEGDAE